MAMEMGYVSIAVFSVIFFFFFLVWRILNRVWFQPKNLERRLRKLGFKGNSYRFFSGDTKEIYAMRKNAMAKPLNLSDDIVPRVVPYFHHTVKKYGKDSFLWIGHRPSLVITDPELIKEVTNNIQDFTKSTSTEFFKLVSQGLAFKNGHVFSQHKKIISPAFHLEKLKLMIPSFSASASDMLRQWEDMISAKGNSVVVDVLPYIQTLSSDALSRTAFGSNYKEGRQVYELQKEQISHCIEKSSTKFSGWRLFPTKTDRRIKETVKIINNLISDMIKTRMKRIKAGEASENTDDLLSILLKEVDSQGGSKQSGLSIQDVVENCKLFYFVGQETTALLLVWMMVLLSRFPEWQTRAREEVFQVFGSNLPNIDGLNQLHIVNMIVYEVLRLYPPVSYFMRTTTKKTKLGNLTLPAGVQLLLQVLLMHHDKELWGEDAKEFKPERFSGGVSKATNGKLIYFPFGWGPRICIGQNFALLEAKITIAMILQKFSFQLSPLYTHGPYFALTLNPQYGAHLILNKL